MSKPTPIALPTPSETTSLLPQPIEEKRKWFPPLRRVMFTSFLLSMTFSFTQTSLIYAFRTMTCDEYYKTHQWGGEGDRCALPTIEASTASSIALMSSVTTSCTIVNLFVTGYWIKRYGTKAAMFQQTAWAAMRNLTQILALTIGGATGMRIIQSTQLFNIMGSGGGYILASNAYIAILAKPEERTSQFGILGGMAMLGSSIGFSVGGIVEYFFGHLAPFQVTFTLLVSCTIFGSIFLPYIDPNSPEASGSAKSSSSGFLAPLKLFIPGRKVQPDGSMKWDFNLFLLGAGAFFSVLATGYVPMALQLVATNVFGFLPANTGMMLSLTLLVRAFFLSICFPFIIKYGRKWYSPTLTPIESSAPIPEIDNHANPGDDAERPESPSQAEPLTVTNAPKPDHSFAPPTDQKHGSAFDLIFLQWSIFLDGVLTACVALSTKGWHMYLAAAVLPFASGTGPAAKGVVLDLVEPDQRADALSAIALIEKLAQVSTIGIFGFLFSILSEMGKPTLVYLANGSIAIVAFILLIFVRMPKVGQIALA